MDCTIFVTKTKALIGGAVAQLSGSNDLLLCFCICKNQFSHDARLIYEKVLKLTLQ